MKDHGRAAFQDRTADFPVPPCGSLSQFFERLDCLSERLVTCPFCAGGWVPGRSSSRAHPAGEDALIQTESDRFFGAPVFIRGPTF